MALLCGNRKGSKPQKPQNLEQNGGVEIEVTRAPGVLQDLRAVLQQSPTALRRSAGVLSTGG